jgi:hypothetical protein
MGDIHADLYNPKSKYKEEEKIEGLTLYDIERKPWPKVRLVQFIQAMMCASLTLYHRSLGQGHKHSPPAS